MKVQLLIIDTQFDFCDPEGALYVPGAEKDCRCLADFIDKNGRALDKIHVTMDAHLPYHIAHPLFWKTRDGKHPDPFMVITSEDIANKKFLPSETAYAEYASYYVSELERKGKYKLCIWPPHCLIGSIGQTLEKNVFYALKRWQEDNIGKTVDYVAKATSPFTEQYSAIQAEIPIKNDPSTGPNKKLIEDLGSADRIIVAGEALSHCVANTVRDLLKYIEPSRFTLLTDCSSSVGGFEDEGGAFVEEIKKSGAETATSDIRL